MIALACNYYPEVLELLREDKISIDYLKFPALAYQLSLFKGTDLSDFQAFISETQKLKPILLHGLNPTFHTIGSDQFIQNFDVSLAQQVLHLCHSQGISLHLSGIDQTLSPSTNQSIITHNIHYLRSFFPHLDYVSLENVDRMQFGICTSPDFIYEVIQQSGADFLLDISHAYYASTMRHTPFEDYLLALPLHQVYEIHINGWMHTPSGIQTHTKINEQGYKTLTKLLTLCTPKIVTLEYGRDSDTLGCHIPLITPGTINPLIKEEILEQITRLQQILLPYQDK